MVDETVAEGDSHIRDQETAAPVRRMTADGEYHLVPLRDGRELEVLDHGRGRVLVFLWGTPGAAVPDPDLATVAERHGLRILQPNRPGYGRSTPHPGRRVVDLVPDLEDVLHHLGIDEVVCMGGSGGGPHALAMAALLPQCLAGAVLVSPAPRDAEGIGFYDGMAVSNREEWLLADQGADVVRPWLEHTAAGMLAGDGQFGDQYDDCLSEPDRRVLAAGDPEVRSARFAKAVERGVEGWLEDDIALTTPWGFEPEDVVRPVSFWTGRQDRFVSPDHSTWLAERVPHADLHAYGDEGHLSLRVHRMDEIVRDLLGKASAPADEGPLARSGATSPG